MVNAVINIVRLARAGFVFARHGIRLLPDDPELPASIKLTRRLVGAVFPRSNDKDRGRRLAQALTKLGPSYIKLGQFLATRDDIIGSENARDLSELQDRLPPFSMAEARNAVKDALGKPVEALFTRFGPCVAAASIAQVHKATISDDGQNREVAVKILRPAIEARFQRDLDSYLFAARAIELMHAPSRRLQPVAIVDTLAQSMAIEMDLRMEAAAISEMAENTANDEGFRVPEVDWTRSAKRVLTLEWIDGIPIADRAAIRKAGHDLKPLGHLLIRSFLRHAMRDGFFHADMHPGNLFVDPAGNIVAVDFGIMGRLGPKEQRFLAEILYGFITRNYRRVAEVHFDAGYISDHHPTELFAQALRAIGEPIMGKTAEEISMARLLGQLFQVTEMFDMQVRPELLLLQKTMVVVEGVARTLDPQLNMWTTAEPVVQEWMETHLGAEGRIQDAADGAATLGRFVGDIPTLLSRAERTANSLASMAADGVRLDDHTIERLASAQAQTNRWGRTALWIAALALVALAVSQF